jgi:hypothetical protein
VEDIPLAFSRVKASGRFCSSIHCSASLRIFRAEFRSRVTNVIFLLSELTHPLQVRHLNTFSWGDIPPPNPPQKTASSTLDIPMTPYLDDICWSAEEAPMTPCLVDRLRVLHMTLSGPSSSCFSSSTKYFVLLFVLHALVSKHRYRPRGLLHPNTGMLRM